MGLEPGFLAGLLILLCAGPPMSPASKPVDVTLRGKVVTLDSALQSLGIDVKPDPESIAQEVVLLGEDRSITPLFRDDASRALFLDERLRDCRAEIHGRRFPGVPYLQVVHVPGRTRRTAPDARILLQRLLHHRPVSADVSMLPRSRWNSG